MNRLHGGRVVWAAILATSTAHAQGVFLPATDSSLRDDITLLADEGVIRLPASAWPLPAADVRAAIERIDAEDIHEPALQFALLRTQVRIGVRRQGGEWELHEVSLTGGEAGLLRDYASPGRDNLELGVIGGAGTDRWSITVAATSVLSPDDGKHFRLDGSDLTVRWGNWLFSANAVPRWWGPGHDGSLILSTNARPMPGLSVDRIRSTPIDFPVLRWLGPWRFTGFVAAAESRRPDLDHPLLMGMRLSFRPAQILEFGLSRTAQFCGQNAAGTRPACNLSQFRRVALGKDNAGMRVDPELEPGNQMAGADVRLVSPFRALPIAAYAQLVGEDGSSTGIPERYLGLFGLEGWMLRENGDVLRARMEYADTSCKFYTSGLQPDCAYRHHIFTAGYRYRDRNIGHTTDSDSESLGLGLSLRRAGGDEWGVHLRRASLDRYGVADFFNPLTAGAGKYRSGSVSWSGRLLGQDVSARAGYEQRDSGGSVHDSGLFGFLQWRKTLME